MRQRPRPMIRWSGWPTGWGQKRSSTVWTSQADGGAGVQNHQARHGLEPDDDGLEYQAAARAAGGVKRQANAHHDPENFDLQQLLGNSQGVQASRTGRLRRAPSQTTPCGRRNRPARLKSDGLLDQRTVAKFVRAGSFPERAPRTSGLTLLDGHRQYVASRTTEGCVKPVHVWNELRARGFTGSLGTVRSAMARDRAAAAGMAPTTGVPKCHVRPHATPMRGLLAGTADIQPSESTTIINASSRRCAVSNRQLPLAAVWAAIFLA